MKSATVALLYYCYICIYYNYVLIISRYKNDVVFITRDLGESEVDCLRQGRTAVADCPGVKLRINQIKLGVIIIISFASTRYNYRIR